MPRILLFTFAFLAALFFPMAVFAQEASVPVLDDAIQDSAAHGSYAAIAAVLVWLAIKIVKRDDIPIPLPPRARPFVALGLGQVYAVLEAVIGGMPWGAAVVRGLVVAATAIAFHEVGSKLPTPKVPLAVFVLLVGCASPLSGFVATADAAATAGEVARPVLREHCVEPMNKIALVYEAAKAKDDKRAAELAQAEGKALADKCDPAIDAQALLLKTHAALRAAILAFHSGVMPSGMQAVLVDLVAAGAKLAQSLSALKGGVQ